ncbi:R-spondin-4 [Tachyglossus aculeatus]|uniref:R-spondin-4 n=1 Tax=Tachyglossus aculeatus TaxID=9261 RepID=UPI0018F4896B|nr:R-spondin-4 [Tachyglossus aculeatus]
MVIVGFMSDPWVRGTVLSAGTVLIAVPGDLRGPDGGPRGSCPGCVSCSEENGCLSCRDKLFLHIGRAGLRQVGLCLHDCPRGHFGLRARDANRCKRCGPACESCFSQDFCIRCTSGSFLHRGKCRPTCPSGTQPRPGDDRECQENSMSRRRGKKERAQQKERKLEPSP